MKINQKKAVIFDLDGTLVDSMWMWKTIDIEYLARYGLECPDDLQREIEGMSFSETASILKGGLALRIPWMALRKPGSRCPLRNIRTRLP